VHGVALGLSLYPVRLKTMMYPLTGNIDAAKSRYE
jgi:hypothetical protein